MQIVYVTETWPPEINGVALTVERTVRHLRRAGHALLLLRPRQRGETPADGRAEWRTPGMPIPLYPDLRLGWAGAGALERRFAAAEPDLVHVATQGPLGRAALQAARRLGVPVTSDFRTNFHQYARHYGLGWGAPLVERYLRRFHAGADATFVPTRVLRDALLRRGFERVEVSGRGVDATLFDPARRSAELRLRWGAGQSTPVLLHVGRLAKEKNVGLVLRCFEALRAQHPLARLVLVGDGPLRERLQAQAAALGPQVIFAGAQRGAALAAHYASADLFVFPSLSETFGNVVPEALASGLGVVAFDAAAAGELIRDGRDGWLATPGDEAGFIARAAAALADPETFAVVRRRARQRALAADWEPVLTRFEHRLREIALGGRASGWRDAALA